MPSRPTARRRPAQKLPTRCPRCDTPVVYRGLADGEPVVGFFEPDVGRHTDGRCAAFRAANGEGSRA